MKAKLPDGTVVEGVTLKALIDAIKARGGVQDLVLMSKQTAASETVNTGAVVLVYE